MDLSSDTWNRVSKLLDEALDLEPDARAMWMEGIRATQSELVPVLRKLLAAHASSETSDLLQQLPAFAAEAVNPIHMSGLVIGSRVGPYRLTREIASGGMADVWLAERADGAFEREVALKLPHLSRLRRDLAPRFAHERDILARLEHPHIARFYDAGVTDDGLPYLAMEYVDGEPITTWCDDRRCEIRTRLHLFTQVLDAVQFAHANLVIHRDLKPSNILVTADGQVRLLDFGIAKLLSEGEMARETQLTQFAGRVLTPDYASPEQIKGEALTTATDVYSLGVVLYELIAGRLPYRLKLQSAAQLEEAIVATDPVRPSSGLTAESAEARGTSEKRLTRALKGDLDTIVLKTLAKEPAHRYATIAELADDLRRYLAGQTVHARPASFGYHARKFIQRNRLAVGAVTAVTLALIGAATVSLWQAQVARKQAARAEQVKEFVLSFFDSADTVSGGTRQTTAIDLLRQARERLDAAHITDNATRVELLTTIGSGLSGLGELQLAEPVLAEASHLATTVPMQQNRIATEARVAYGFVLRHTGKPDLAEAQFDAAETGARRAGDMRLLSAALRGKAGLRVDAGQDEKAFELAREAVSAAERQVPPVDKRELIQAYTISSFMAYNVNRKEALEPARRAYELARDLYGDRPTAPLLHARSAYALALAEAGDPAEALAETKALLRQQTETLGASHVEVANTHFILASLYLRLGDPTVAVAHLREILRIYLADSKGKPTPLIAMRKLNLGLALASAHRYAEAMAEWRETEQAYSTLFGPESEGARLARSGVGLALTKLGRLEEADAIFARLVERPYSSPIEEAYIEGHLGLLRSAQGRHDEAQALLRGARASFGGGEQSERYRALSLANLATALLGGGQVAQSLELLHQARTLLLKSQRNGSPELVDITVDSTRAQLALGRAEEALVAADEAVAFWSRFDPSHRDAGIALLWQARALAAAGQTQKASQTWKRASAILASTALPADRTLLTQTGRELHAGSAP